MKNLEDQIQQDQEYRQHKKEASKVIKTLAKEYIRETSVRLEEHIFKKKISISSVESEDSLFPPSTISESDFENNYSDDSESGTVETTPDILKDLDLEKDFEQLFVEFENVQKQTKNQQKIVHSTKTYASSSSGSEYISKQKHFRIPIQPQVIENLRYPVERATPTNSECSDWNGLMYSIERATPTNSEMTDYHEPNSTPQHRQNVLMTHSINVPTSENQHPTQQQPLQQQPLLQHSLPQEHLQQHRLQQQPLQQQPQENLTQQELLQQQPLQQQPQENLMQQEFLQQQPLQQQTQEHFMQQEPLQFYSGHMAIQNAKMDDREQSHSTKQSRDLSELEVVHERITKYPIQKRKNVVSEKSGTQQLSEFEQVHRKITKRYK